MGRGRPPTCPFCGGVRSVSKGTRRTKRLGIRRIRRCKGCGRKFTPRHQKPSGQARLSASAKTTEAESSDGKPT